MFDWVILSYFIFNILFIFFKFDKLKNQNSLIFTGEKKNERSKNWEKIPNSLGQNFEVKINELGLKSYYTYTT